MTISSLTYNSDQLTSRVYHGLKSLFNPDDTLPPRYLEYAICKSFDLDHVGDGNYYADGVRDNIQVSIKTRMINPHVLKTKEGRDFQTHPEKFLGPQHNKKQDRWTGGLEIVQRRQALNFDDIKATPKQVGEATLEGFQENVKQSADRYATDTSIEIVAVHGYNHNRTNYILDVFWQQYKPLDPETITWVREGYGVSGNVTFGNVLHKVVERVNGNAKREATCFKEYRDLTKYQNHASISVPIPQSHPFDQAQILQEIAEKSVA